MCQGVAVVGKSISQSSAGIIFNTRDVWGGLAEGMGAPIMMWVLFLIPVIYWDDHVSGVHYNNAGIFFNTRVAEGCRSQFGVLPNSVGIIFNTRVVRLVCYSRA